MKKIFFLSLFLFATICMYGQTGNTASTPFDVSQFITISTDTGLSILPDSNLKENYKIPIPYYRWNADQVDEVISYFTDRSDLLSMSKSPDGTYIMVELLIVEGQNDSWGIEEWNNHLNTIK